MRCFIVISTLLLHLLTHAQDRDSLVSALNSARTVDDKVATQVRLYHAWWQDSSQVALSYLDEARKLIHDVESETTKARLLSAIGSALYHERKSDSSLYYLDQALTLFDAEGEQVEVAHVLADIGLNYYSQNHFQRAMDAYLQAMKILESEKQTIDVIDLRNRMAMILIQQEQFTQALEYLKANLARAGRSGSEVDRVKGAFNIANVLKRDGRLEAALAYCDSTITFAKVIEMEFGVAKANGMKAYVLLDLHRPDEALEAIEAAEEIFMRMDAKVDLFQMMLARARVAQEKQQYEQMWNFARKARNSYLYIQDSELLLELYDAEYTAALNTGRYKEALDAGEQRSLLKDSIFKISNAEKINQLLTQYETEKKDREIEQLQYHGQLQELKLSQRNTQLLVGAVVALLIGLVGVVYFQKRKFDHLQAVSDMEQRLLRSQMNPHFIFNALGSIQNFILTNQSSDSVKYLAKFSQLMRQILEHSRAEYISLQEEEDMLRIYLEIQQLRFDPPFRFAIEVHESLEAEEVEIPPLFAQPFVENAIEHGILGQPDGLIRVHFLPDIAGIKVVISDSGGAKAPSPKSKEHRSLATIITRERLDILSKKWKQNFTLEIIQDEGTQVTLHLPAKGA